jgi:hypothetical protein
MSATAGSITLKGNARSDRRLRARWMAVAALAAGAVATSTIVVAGRSGTRTVPAPVAQTKTQGSSLRITGTGPDLVAVASQNSVPSGPMTGTGPGLEALARAPVDVTAPVTGTGPDLTAVGAWWATGQVGGGAGGPAAHAAARSAARLAGSDPVPPAQRYAHQIAR